MRNHRGFRALAIGLGLSLCATAAYANGYFGGGVCSRTARLMYQACGSELKDDNHVGWAVCINTVDPAERQECYQELWGETFEAKQECVEQLEARRDLCEKVGEAAYDPDFDPEDFESDFHDLQATNDYYPVPIGGQWAYESEDETDLITVQDATKNVEGVTCVVVNDVVTGEESIEDTNDWIAQAKNGDVWYCGEESKDFEFFEGDDPEIPELVSIEGSFKHGVDGAKGGILFLGAPVVGTTYRQEVSLGDAEDAATVVSTSYGYGDDEDLDELVPEALAEQYCPDDDCVVTVDFSPLEPGGFERKYYSKGVGVFLETKPEDGEVNALVGCNVDPKCSPLP